MHDFQIENGVLIKYTGPGGNVVIPEGVTSIGVLAFDNCKNLVSILIPDSVVSIGACAFYQCSKLVSVTMPRYVRPLGRSAFTSCRSLLSVIIPDGVSAIRSLTFAYCDNLKTVVIPDSVRSIARQAFLYCERLTSVTIPEHVTIIGKDAFSFCRNLTFLSLPQSLEIPNGRWIKTRFKKAPLEVLRAPGKPLSLLAPYQPAAAVGYVEMKHEGLTFPEALEAEYLDYFRSHPEDLYPYAISRPVLLRYMMDNKFIPLEGMDTLLALANERKRPDLKAEVLSYAHSAFSEDQRKQVLDLTL